MVVFRPSVALSLALHQLLVVHPRRLPHGELPQIALHLRMAAERHKPRQSATDFPMKTIHI